MSAKRPCGAPARHDPPPSRISLTAPPLPPSFQLRDSLKVGNIYLHSNFFSVQLDDREAVKIIRDELTRFAIVVEPAKTLFGKVRSDGVGLTAKRGGSYHGFRMKLTQ